MRILYAVHGYKPAYRIGGPIISVSSAAEMLVSKGHHITVFTTNSNLDEDLDVPTDQPVDVNGVEVWYFKHEEYIQRWLPWITYLSKSLGFLYTPKMRHELERVVPGMDVIHTHMPYVYPTYATGRSALRHGKPLFYHQRGVFDPERLKFRGGKKRLYISAFERPLMQRATTLFALTDAEVKSYRMLGIHTPCRVIPNGIDVSRYREKPVSPGTKWHFDDKSLVILFLGRVHPIKGADKLLEAFTQIHSKFPQAILVLAGPDEFGLEERFKDVVRTEGLTERVFFPGMVSGSEKTDLLARANLFCLPSDAEGFSMAILEALASSTPVLISPGCHFPEVETAGAGIVAPSDPPAIASALEGLLHQPARLAEMGHVGRELVSTRYTWDRITEELLEAYNEGIHRHKSELS